MLFIELFCGGGKSSQGQTPVVKQFIDESDTEVHNEFMELVQSDRFGEITDELLSKVKKLPRSILITPRTSLNLKELNDKRQFNFVSHTEINKIKQRLDKDRLKNANPSAYDALLRKYKIMCSYCNIIVSPQSIERVFLYEVFEVSLLTN